MAVRPDLSFSCRCGAIVGKLIAPGPRVGDHVVCHCSDCRAFADYLDAGDVVLDEHGGTALYQGRCATMRIDTGIDRLACLHLTDKPTLRWYAACCRAPMFNSYKNGRIPYITTVVANCDAERRESVLGPVTGHLFTDEAIGDASHLKQLKMARLMRRFFRRMLTDLITGSRRRAALFDPQTLEPIAVPMRGASAAR